MRRIQLPGGGWAEIREQADLRVQHRAQLRSAVTGSMVAMSKIPAIVASLPDDPEERAAAIAKIDMSELTAHGALTFDDAQALQHVQEVAVVTFLVAWSLHEPLPTLETVGDMHIEIFDAIADATTQAAASVLEGVDFSPNPKVEPGNPTGNPSDSNGRSLGRDESPSTPTSPIASSNTGTEG